MLVCPCWYVQNQQDSAAILEMVCATCFSLELDLGAHVVNILSSDGERMSMISSMNFRWFELCLIVMIDRC